jgi:hypothetical protein
MGMIILYLLAHMFMGAFTGFMGICVNLESHKTKIAPYFLIIAIICIVYMAVMLGLAGFIGWIDRNWVIPDSYIGLFTVLMLLSVYPGVLFAKKLFGSSKSK